MFKYVEIMVEEVHKFTVDKSYEIANLSEEEGSKLFYFKGS